VRIGVVISPYERVPEADGTPPPDATPRFRDVREQAIAAEDLGYASVWLPDHLLYRPDDAPTFGFWEAWTFLSAIAAVTHRVELGTFVLCMGYRNPALVAKQADALDEISGGRLILGLGAGWHPAEFAGLGMPFDHRGDRFEEALRIICPLLREGHVDVRGDYHSARDMELRPRGPRPAGPPILIGTSARSSGRRVRALTARYADQHNMWARRAEQLPEVISSMDEACLAEGRDPASLVRTVGIVVLETPDPTEQGPRAPATIPMADTETWIETLSGYAAAGISHVQVALEPMSVESLETFAPVVAALRDA
jgi:alkanesulfonate monooxygenase SsuD/methylene tetrahydromethanopterin reductase-like flavin-dependent oxidoreductase (luciferase family)